MEVFLLPTKKGYKLYANEPERPAAAGAARDEEAKRVVDGVRRVYRETTAKSQRTERLLRELSGHESIRVLYPSSLSETRARQTYEQLLEREVRKHKRWLWVDGAALPASALLTILPGPNIVLAYLAFRTFAHYKTKKAGEKAARLDVRFVEDPKLRELEMVVRKRFCLGRTRKIHALGTALGLPELEQAY